METQFRPQDSNIMMMIIIVGFLMIAYMLYSLTLSIYRNYSINVHIQNFERTNIQLQKEIEDKMKSYAYYTSPEYQDKIAKQNLGRVNSREEVIVIPPSAVISVFEFDDIEAANAAKRARMSNLRRWWEFFFAQNPFRY